jgi:hypothetical protein
MTHEDRRKGDQLQQQIEDLIVAASDPKDKAFLLIMNKIATSLDANTSLTKALSDDFKSHTVAFSEHERKEMELINQGRGGFRVALALLAVLQVFVGFVITNTLADIKDTKQDVITLQREVAIHKEHHALEEREKKSAPRVGP